MKKLLLPIAIVAFLFSCNNASKETKETKDEIVIAENSNWSLDRLQGMVKSIEETEFTADSAGQIGEMDSCCIEIENFNKDGFTESFMDKNSDGVTVKETKVIRNEDGKFMEYINSKDGQADGGRKATRDADGKMIMAVDRDGSGEVKFFYKEIEENEFGQAFSAKGYLADSTFNGNWTGKYIDGVRAGSTWVDSTGTQLSDYTGEINEKGFISKMTSVVNKGEDGNITEVYTFTYDSFDEAGNWTQRSKFDEEGKLVQVKKRAYTYFE